MVTGPGRRLLAALLGAALLVSACSDDDAAPASSTTTSAPGSTTTAAPTADGVSVTPDGQIQWEYDLVVWLEPEVPEGEKASIAAEITGSAEIAAAEFSDQGATMAEFERIFAAEPELLEAVEAEDLPPSWRVKLVDCGNTAAADELSLWFEGMPGVRSVVAASSAVVVAC